MRDDLRRCFVGVVALLTCVFAAHAAAEQPAALAERILQAVDRSVGLVHLPRCGRGELALAFAEADEGLCVHGQDADASAVAAARKAADEAGLLNRRASFDQGDTNRLLPVSRTDAPCERECRSLPLGRAGAQNPGWAGAKDALGREARRKGCRSLRDGSVAIVSGKNPTE